MSAKIPTTKSSKPVHKRVEFVLRHDHAKDVVITGDFTSWTHSGVPLAKGPDGVWRTILTLAPGEHQYRLRVNGMWEDHPQARKRVPNPFGTENCILTVD